MRCLDREPARRPASAAQVVAALPGGDPLQAALLAGETPSPELVAASGSIEAIQPTLGLVLFGALVLCIIALLWLSPSVALWTQVPMLTPQEFTARGRDVDQIGE